MEALQGKYNVLLFRPLKLAASQAGAKIAFQTDHSKSSRANTTSVETKDGNISASGAPEKDYQLNFIAAKDDSLLGQLEEAHNNGEKVEIWDVQIDPDTLNPSQSSQHPGTYCQAIITDMNTSSPANDNIKVSLSCKVELIPQKGSVTITAAQAQAIQYAFTDTPAVGG